MIDSRALVGVGAVRFRATALAFPIVTESLGG